MSHPKPPNWYLDPLAAAQKRDVHRAWIQRNVPPDVCVQTVLKTDLFEEAHGGDELLFSLPLDAELKVGCDLSLATAAQAGIRGRNSGCRCIAADVRHLPLPDECIDLVLSNSTLDHFDTERDIEDSLRELTRVLKPGGLLLVSLDNPRNVFFLLLRRALPWTGVPFHLGKTLPRAKLLRILQQAGLEIQSSELLIHNPRFLSTLLFLALRRLFGRRADAPIRQLLAALAQFDKLPTRALTGVFIAACARKPAASPAKPANVRTVSEIVAQ